MCFRLRRYIRCQARKERAWRKEYVRDRYGNEIYITEERWEHIQQEHPDMVGYCQHVLETLRLGNRKQDDLETSKYLYVKALPIWLLTTITSSCRQVRSKKERSRAGDFQ